MNKKVVSAHVSMLVSTIFFALNIPAVKYLFEGWITPGNMLFTRLVFGAVVFWIISFFMESEKIVKKDFILFLLGGAIGLFGMQYFYMMGLSKTSPIDTSIILTIPPVLVLLFSAFVYHERLTLKKIIGILLGISGALLIILSQKQGLGKSSGNTEGNFYVLLSSISWAVYILFTHEVSSRYNPITILKWMFLWAAIPTVILFGDPLFEDGIFLKEPSPDALYILLFILIFPTVISYLLIPKGLKYLSVSTGAMYSYAVPLIASGVAILIGQASLRWDQPVAVVLICMGVYWVNAKSKK